jgi:hypothetical protein
MRVGSNPPSLRKEVTMSVAMIALACAVSAIILMLCAIDPANDAYRGEHAK